MQRGFGGTALEPLEKRRDRELTLGPTMLALLGLGLFTLCGVCFVFGYAVGQHGSPTTPATPTAGVSTAASAAGTAQNPAVQSKPAPSQNSFQARTAAQAPAASVTEDSANQTSDSGQPAQSEPISTKPAQSSAPPSSSVQTPASVVQAALPGQSGGTQAAVVTGTVVKPALTQSSVPSGTQSGTWMVQIAAVSHPEDADVLVSALRKHGYAVSVHRDPIDALMHVQVGPFATHNDAAAMRQKLLNDGYNAMVQP